MGSTDDSVEQSLPPGDLPRVMGRTYFWLRVFLAGFALALPLVLTTWAATQSAISGVGYSISGYYHCRSIGEGDGLFSLLGTPLFVGDFMVGVLCAVGTLLMVYQGLTWLEDSLLNIAGVAICCVALFPCGRSEYPKLTAAERTAAKSEQGAREVGVRLPVIGMMTAHGLSAGVFFVALASVAVLSGFSSYKELESTSGERFFATAYVLIAIAMVGVPAWAWASFGVAKNPGRVFVAEACAVAVFAAYWVIQTIEFHGESGRTRQVLRYETRRANRVRTK